MSALSLPAGIAVGAVVAIIGGFAYQKLIDVIPFIYVNVLLTCGFAFVIGLAVARTLIWAKTRNVLAAGAVGAVAGVIAVGFTFHVAQGWHTAEWADAAQREYRLDPQMSVEQRAATVEAIRSMSLSDYLDARVDMGWTVGPIEFTGLMVWFMWLIEAGILCGGAALIAAGGATSPFCERCDTYTRAEKIGTIRSLTPAALRRAAQTGGIQGVLALEEGGGNARLVLTMNACPRCDRTRFVHGVGHWFEKSSGESKEQEEDLLADIVPTREDLDALAARFPAVTARRRAPDGRSPRR